MAQDVKLEWGEDGYLDIVFESNDDPNDPIREIVEEDGLMTAIQVSLFSNKLATSLEIPDNYKRNGFLGTLLEEGNHEGSGLYLLDARRMSDQLLADAENYTRDALAWLIDDGIADSIEVATAKKDERSIFIYIYLYKNADRVGDYITIWQNTVV